MQVYDEAPELAGRVFGEMKNDPQAIIEEFARLRSSEQDPEKLKSIGSAYNFAVITAFFRNGEQDKARDFVGALVRGDKPITFLNQLLRSLGSDFYRECEKRSELLVPSSLDALLFERYIQGPASQANDYFDHEAMLVINYSGNDVDGNGIYYGKGVVTSCLGGATTIIGDGPFNMTQRTIEINPLHLSFKGIKSGATKIAKKMFEETGVDDYVILHSKHFGMNEYLPTRFVIKVSGLIDSMSVGGS
jgi:hypothetical protein